MLRTYVYVVSGVKWSGKEFRSKKILLELTPRFRRVDARNDVKELKAMGFRTYFARYAFDGLSDMWDKKQQPV